MRAPGECLRWRARGAAGRRAACLAERLSGLADDLAESVQHTVGDAGRRQRSLLHLVVVVADLGGLFETPSANASRFTSSLRLIPARSRSRGSSAGHVPGLAADDAL